MPMRVPSQNRHFLTGGGIVQSADFSACGTYRYALRRIWLPAAPQVLFIGLNPSTADEKSDDPTIRRCLGFARSWGYGGLIVANLFAYRATAPSALREARDPIGPLNDLVDRKPGCKSRSDCSCLGESWPVQAAMEGCCCKIGSGQLFKPHQTGAAASSTVCQEGSGPPVMAASA